MSGYKNTMSKASSEEETLDLSNIGMEEVALEDGQNFIASQQSVSTENQTRNVQKLSESQRGVQTIPSGSGFTFVASAGEDTDIDELGGGFESETNDNTVLCTATKSS